jgi:hypothetical protein
MTDPRLRLASAAVAAVLAAGLAAAPAQAAPPFDEINDVQWCVDQTSSLVQGAVEDYAGFAADTYDANYRSIKCKLHQHPPIVINGRSLDWQNAQGNPATLQALYGIVRGTGTAWDPYVIQNWEFPGSDKATVHTSASSSVDTPAVPEHDAAFDSGITIVNTDQHFVIDRVYAHGWSGAAIRVGRDWLAGGGYPTVTVQGSIIKDSAKGVEAFNDFYPQAGQPKVRVVDNDLLGVGIGVHAWGSYWVQPLQASVEGNLIQATQTGVVLAGRGGSVTSNAITSADRGIVAYGNAATIAWNQVTAPRAVYLSGNGGSPSWGATSVHGNAIRGHGYDVGLAIEWYRSGATVQTGSNDIRGTSTAVWMNEGTLRMLGGDVLDCSDGARHSTWCNGVFYRGASSAHLSGVTIRCHGGGTGVAWKLPASDPVTSGVSIDTCHYHYARYA